MNILFVYIDHFKNYDISLVLENMGYHTEAFEDVFWSLEKNEDQQEKLDAVLMDNKYDVVMSYGYSSEVSQVCKNRGLIYISWTYDSPCTSIYNDTIFNENNRMFIFDKSEYTYVSNMFKDANVYYLPLGVNVNRLYNMNLYDINDSFQSDVSFVGTMYSNNQYDELLPVLNESNRLYFRQVFDYFAHKWSGESIYDWFSKDEIQYLKSALPKYTENNTLIGDKIYYSSVLLSKKIANIERIDILNHLGEISRVKVYSGDAIGVKSLKNMEIESYINYYDDMYRVFRNSKINLNITIRGIKTGIPLRAMDIMGVGGFLLSNYQEELDELFCEGKDMEMYRSVDELTDKVKFYIKHDKERENIRQSGLNNILNSHTYEHRLKTMIESM